MHSKSAIWKNDINMLLYVVNDLALLKCVFVMLMCVFSEKIPMPENVRVLSSDMGLQLMWDPPKNISDQLLKYTAEMRSLHFILHLCRFTTSITSHDFIKTYFHLFIY